MVNHWTIGVGTMASAVGFTLWLTSGCAHNEDRTSPRPMEMCLESEVSDKIARLRGELLEKIERSSCGVESCDSVSRIVSASFPVDISLGQRVLVIDDAVVFPAATRYRSRVIAFAQRADDGTYGEFSPTIDLPRDADDVLAKIDGFPVKLRADHLNIAEPFFRKFHLPDGAYGHGSDIFALIADFVPNAQFVVSDDQLDPPLDCKMLSQAAGFEDARFEFDRKIDRIEESLSAIIRRYKINAVHLSWGFGRNEIVEIFQDRCGSDPGSILVNHIMDRYVTLLRAISELEVMGEGGRPTQVVIFQAGSAHLESDPNGRSLDCASIERRIRVYSVPYTGRSVSREGSYDRSLLPKTPPGIGFSCNDVFVVLGYESPFSPVREGSYFGYRTLGLGITRPAWPATSSFANPIALAYFFELRQQDPSATVSELIFRLTRGRTQPILDPLAHEFRECR